MLNIDQLRDLLGCDDRRVVSITLLSDLVETTDIAEMQRSFLQGEDRAFVVVGPVHGFDIQRFVETDGLIVYRVAVRPEALTQRGVL